MSTTSLKLSESLKTRVSQLAQTSGTSPHAFMADAIERVAEATERRNRFVAEALDARQHMVENNTGYSADEIHAYLKKRAKDIEIERPQASTWRK